MDSIFRTAADDIPKTPKPAAPKKRGAQNTRASENAAPQEPKKSKRRKKEKVDENQLSLFDFAAYAA